MKKKNLEETTMNSNTKGAGKGAAYAALVKQYRAIGPAAVAAALVFTRKPAAKKAVKAA